MRYDVLLADPPWTFKNYNNEMAQSNSDHHYPTMGIEEIKALPVDNVTKENAVLFIWGIWSLLPECLEVINAWGFTYKTEAWVWAKMNKNSFGYCMGMGYYTRSNTEYCLIATSGNVPRVADGGVLGLIASPRREHSRKPDEQYGKIERLYPEARKLELFARRKREGWHSWGNEIESDVELAMI